MFLQVISFIHEFNLLNCNFIPLRYLHIICIKLFEISEFYKFWSPITAYSNFMNCFIKLNKLIIVVNKCMKKEVEVCEYLIGMCIYDWKGARTLDYPSSHIKCNGFDEDRIKKATDRFSPHPLFLYNLFHINVYEYTYI